jgi:hypothetical protein
MGVEIISAAFGSQALSEIVRAHHAHFGGSPDNPGLPVGHNIPLGARILTIADAFDAMVSERPYHRPKNKQQAFDELRRCAGKQFDPELVERLITAILASDQARLAKPLPKSTMSNKTALRVRLEIERLACALDDQDLTMLTAMAGHIAAVAAKDGLGQIAQVATSLQKSAGEHADLEGILKLTNELLELARSPQSLDASHLGGSRGNPPPRALPAAGVKQSA